MHTLLSKVNDYVLEKIALVEKWICTYHLLLPFFLERDLWQVIRKVFFNDFLFLFQCTSFSFSGG